VPKTSAAMDIGVGKVSSRTDDQEESDHTIRSSRRSRTGAGVVRHPGPGAAADELIEYGQYLMSGRGTFFCGLCQSID